MVTKTGLKTTAVQTPSDDNHTTVLRQLKEVAEVGQRLRGDPNDSFVRVSELTNAGIMRLVNGTLQPPTSQSLPGSVVPSTRSVLTSGSLVGGGTLAANLTLQLDGDNASPGNNRLYGTNGSGVKGWYVQPSGGGGSSNVTPDTHPASANALDDEFEAGSLDGKWAWVNQTTSTATLADGHLLLTDANNSADNFAAIVQTISGTFKVRAKTMRASGFVDNRGGLYVGLASNGKAYGFGIFFSAGNLSWYVNKYTNATTFSATLASSTAGHAGTETDAGGQYMYQEVEYDGTNVIFRYSTSGVSGTFIEFTRDAAFLGAAPVRAGIFADRGSATVDPFIVDWFRRIS